MGKAYCLICFQQKTGMISVETIQQQLGLALRNTVSELKGQTQILSDLIGVLNNYKDNLIKTIDKTIGIMQNQLKSLNSSKDKLKQIREQTENQLSNMKQFKNELISQKEKFRSTIAQLFQEYEQKLNIDHLLNLLYDEKYNQCNQQQKENIGSRIKTQGNQESKIKKKVEYQLIKDQTRKQGNKCCAFAFNSNNTILLIGCENEIVVNGFNNGKIGSESQRLKKHTDTVTCLYFMKQTKSFVSCGNDNLMIIWCVDKINSWVVKQILQEHQKQVYCLQMNIAENLLISGSDDKQIKFWKKQNEVWRCQQSISLTNEVLALSLNDNEDKLISCGSQQKIYVMELKSDQQWNIKQEIKTRYRGLRICFTLGNQFAFQPYCGEFIEIYDLYRVSQQFIQISQAQSKQQMDCALYFPILFSKLQNFLTVKNGKQLNIYKVSQDGKYQIIQTIQFETSFIFGQMTDDDENLVVWDGGLKQIQFRKLSKLD